MIHPNADRSAQNLEIISKDFEVRARRTRILMRFMIRTLLLPGDNPESRVPPKLWRAAVEGFRPTLPRSIGGGHWCHRPASSKKISFGRIKTSCLGLDFNHFNVQFGIARLRCAISPKTGENERARVLGNGQKSKRDVRSEIGHSI